MFRKNSGIENLQAKEGGSFTVLSKIFSSHKTEKNFSREPFCFRKFLVGKKIICIRGGGGVSRFYRNFLSHRIETKSFVNEPFCFPEIFWYRKTNMDKRGHTTIFSRNFWSHSAEKFRGHPFNVSENLGHRKILCIVEGITVFRRTFFVSQCRKISWASLQCLRTFGVSKNFMHNRGYQVFPAKIFGLSPKKFRGHPFNVSENLRYRKILWIIGGIKIFRRKFFCLTVPKNFVKEPFSVSLILGIKKC